MTYEEKQKISDDAFYLLLRAIIRDCLIDIKFDIDRKIKQTIKAYEKLDKGNITPYHKSLIETKRLELVRNRDSAIMFFQNNPIFIKGGDIINYEYLLNKADKILEGVVL